MKSYVHFESDIYLIQFKREIFNYSFEVFEHNQITVTFNDLPSGKRVSLIAATITKKRFTFININILTFLCYFLLLHELLAQSKG